MIGKFLSKTGIICAVLIFLLVFSHVGWGYVYGGTNLGFQGYPSLNSSSPSPPFSKDSYWVESYKNEVEIYIDETESYVENAKNDIKRIQEAMEEAIRSANNVVDEYNLFVSRNY